MVPAASRASPLQMLEHLHLNDNRLSGTLPPSIASLTHLVSLLLGGNLLGGTMQDIAWHDMASLRYLVLASNNLQGTVPERLLDCRALPHLQVCV